jgi:uncharacterized membrane protein
MTTGMSEEEIYRKARERVEEKKGFYIHLIVYILVNIMLIIIWVVTGAGFPWFIFPLGGWGIGILFHFLGIFVFSQRTGWERRQVEKEVERLKRGE